MNRLSIAGLSLLVAAAAAQAATPPRYRIDLRAGGHVYSWDLPVFNGSVVVFHELPGGSLTELPRESILSIDGTPVLAQPGTPEAAAPVAGPNAAPVLAGERSR